MSAPLLLILVSLQSAATAVTTTAARIDGLMKWLAIPGAVVATSAACWTIWRKALLPGYRVCTSFMASIDQLIEKVAGIEREMRPNGGSSMRDVVNGVASEIKQLTRDFAVTTAMQRTMASASRSPMFQATSGGHFAWVNETWSRTTGLPLGESVGMGWVNAIHPDDRQRVVSDWFHAVRDGRSFRADFRCQHVSTLEDVRVRCEAHPIPWGSGLIAGFIGTAHLIDPATGDVGTAYERRASPGAMEGAA